MLYLDIKIGVQLKLSGERASGIADWEQAGYQLKEIL
jgi:hypothetical protein